MPCSALIRSDTSVPAAASRCKHDVVDGVQTDYGRPLPFFEMTTHRVANLLTEVLKSFGRGEDRRIQGARAKATFDSRLQRGKRSRACKPLPCCRAARNVSASDVCGDAGSGAVGRARCVDVGACGQRLAAGCRSAGGECSLDRGLRARGRAGRGLARHARGACGGPGRRPAGVDATRCGDGASGRLVDPFSTQPRLAAQAHAVGRSHGFRCSSNPKNGRQLACYGKSPSPQSRPHSIR
jgi:hypothetical protein